MKHRDKANNTVCEATVGDRVVADASKMLNNKPYEAPVLVAYGDVRDVTLGGTIGFGESGAGFQDFDPIRP